MKTFKQFIVENNIPDYYKDDNSFKNYWKEKGVDNMVMFGRGYVRPHHIRIDKSSRGEGLGTSFMTDLCKFSDYHKLQIRLSPSKDFGATSVPRLIEFYKRFGFVENKGKNKDYQFSETMYRIPK